MLTAPSDVSPPLQGYPLDVPNRKLVKTRPRHQQAMIFWAEL